MRPNGLEHIAEASFRSVLDHMRPEIFMPRKERINDLLDLLGVLSMPMAKAVKGAELASFGG